MGIIVDSELINILEQLSFNSKLTVDSLSMGRRKSNAKGSSVEFSDYREYMPGDDFRRVDWKAYARFEKLFIKLYMEERESSVSIFLDTSASMNWGTPNKSIVSRKLAAAFSYIALSNYDSVSLNILNNSLHSSLNATNSPITNVKGKQRFMQLANVLENLNYIGDSSLLEPIKRFTPKKSGITIIISDFLCDENFENIIKHLTYLKQKIYICHVLSPQELNPELENSVRLIDSENNSSMDISISSSLFTLYNEKLESFINNINKACTHYNCSYSLINSEMSIKNILKDCIK